MSRLTKLEAVNRILRAASESPVNSLVSTETNDVTAAVNTLDQVSRQVQLEGFIFNSERQTLKPDAAGTVYLPRNTLRVSADPLGAQYDLTLVARGNRLFNAGDSTFAFSGPVDVALVVELEFEDLPPDMQFEIVDLAAVEYQADVLGSDQVDRRLQNRAELSRVRNRSNETKNRRANWVNRPRPGRFPME